MKDASASNSSQRGNSTLEILIALAILTITMTCVILVTLGNQVVTSDTPINSEALQAAKAMIEKAHAQSVQSFVSVIASSSTNDLYTKQLNVVPLTQCQKRITGHVQWATDPSRAQNISLTTDLVDLALGGDCASLVATQSWSSPKTYSGIDLGISIPTGLDTQDAHTFISTIASVSSSPDLFVLNTTDPIHPTIISTIDTGAGINAVDIAHGYAFAANNSSTGQLQVIDVSDVAHPLAVAVRSLPGVAGAEPQGRTIFYYHSRVYIGTKRTAGNELHIYDVSTPSNPINIGHIEVNYNVNAIAVQGTTAYLAVSAGAANSLLTYNVADPAHLPLPTGMNPCTGGGKSLYIAGTRLYLGCTHATGVDDLFVLDISVPANPVILGSTRVGSDINAIRVAGTTAFLATSDTHREFQVWNISNPAGMTLISSVDTPKNTVGIDYEHDTVYLGIQSNDALRIILAH